MSRWYGRRRLRWPILFGLLLVVLSSLAVVITSSRQATQASGANRPLSDARTRARTATCSEPTATGRATWTATYETNPADVTAIRVVGLGSSNPAPVSPPGMWTLWWVKPNDVVAQVSSTSTDPTPLRAPSDLAVLLPPGNTCALVLTSMVTTGPIGVIGDSVLSSISAALASQRLAPNGFTRRLLVTAESGFGWGASAPTWPLSEVRGSWAVGLARGLVARAPRCLVVELGANDALRASFADVLKERPLAADIRRGAEDNMNRIVALTTSEHIRTVFVTAPEYPVTAYKAGYTYSREAAMINTTIRSVAAASHGNVVVADWAVESAQHHSVNTSDQNWFINDELHPNDLGDQALLNLVQSATSRAGC